CRGELHELLAPAPAAPQRDDARDWIAWRRDGTPVAPDRDSAGIAASRHEQLEGAPPPPRPAQPEGVPCGVERELQHPARDRPGVDAREGGRPADPLPARLGALAVEEPPAALAHLLPEPEGRMGPEPVLEIELGRDPRVGIRRVRVDAVLSDEERR